MVFDEAPVSISSIRSYKLRALEIPRYQDQRAASEHNLNAFPVQVHDEGQGEELANSVKDRSNIQVNWGTF